MNHASLGVDTFSLHEVPPTPTHRCCFCRDCVQVLVAHLLDTFNAHLLTALPRQHQQQPRQLQQPYGISVGLPKGLALPTSGLKQDWLAYAAALPSVDQPSVLGLPANIGRSIALANSKRLLASLRQINVAQVGRCQPPVVHVVALSKTRSSQPHTTRSLHEQAPFNAKPASGLARNQREVAAPPAYICWHVQGSGLSGFHLQQQLPQLQPALRLWEQLAASLTPTMRQLVVEAAGGAAAAKPASAAAERQATAAAAADASPVAAFVTLELELGVALLRQVAQTLSAIQAALAGDAHVLTAATQVRSTVSTAAGRSCRTVTCTQCGGRPCCQPMASDCRFCSIALNTLSALPLLCRRQLLLWCRVRCRLLGTPCGKGPQPRWTTCARPSAGVIGKLGTQCRTRSLGCQPAQHLHVRLNWLEVSQPQASVQPRPTAGCCKPQCGLSTADTQDRIVTHCWVVCVCVQGLSG